MRNKIIILGNLSEADLELIDQITRQHEYEVSVAGDDDSQKITDPEMFPAAYLSFLACTSALVLEQFSNLPIGVGEKTPFFQAGYFLQAAIIYQSITPT